MFKFAQISIEILKNAYMKYLFRGVILSLTFLLAFGCISNEKIIYLQNLEGNTPIEDGELITYEIPDYKLQYNDIIDVNVQTAVEMIENGFTMQPSTSGGGSGGTQGGGDVYYRTGYTVDRDGNIRLPFVGLVKVENMTLEEARVKIEEMLKEYVKSEIYVKVKLGGIRYAALGEFKNPGKFVVLQDRMTVFEAIANAGDLTILAKRDEVLLIRQYPDGTRLHRINLVDRELVRSPFYFIQPNDQLYAEPMKIREIGSGENAVQSFALLITAVSGLALILNLIK